MARARNIKPAFFSNDTLADIEPLGRLFFIGLWTIADYRGNIEWRDRRLKAQILPYDECDVKSIAINLDKSGFIRFYSDGDNIFLNITNFLVHQNPHKNERDKGSLIPEFNEEGRQVIDFKGLTINRDKSGLNQDENGSDPADSLILNPESPIPYPDTPCNSDEFLPVPSVPEKKARIIKSDTWKRFYEEYPEERRGGSDATPWKKAKQKRLTEFDFLDMLEDVIKRKASCPQWHQGFVQGITKYIDEEIWKTPIRASQLGTGNDHSTANASIERLMDTDW